MRELVELALLLTTPFDILLSDIGMPDRDGYELMRKICQTSSEPGGQVTTIAKLACFPAVALTAYAGEMNQQQALTAGFQGPLAKPIEPDDLVRTIVTLMGKNCLS